MIEGEKALKDIVLFEAANARIAELEAENLALKMRMTVLYGYAKNGIAPEGTFENIDAWFYKNGAAK